MKRITALTGFVVVMCLSGGVLAQEGSVGEAEYKNNCASCHGTSGKGNGPFAEFLKNGAPSLRNLSKSNGGVFPVARVYGIIDGRSGIRSHGTAEMPVWGSEYTIKSKETHGPFFGEYYADDIVRVRIMSLIDHLNSLQDK